MFNVWIHIEEEGRDEDVLDGDAAEPMKLGSATTLEEAEELRQRALDVQDLGQVLREALVVLRSQQADFTERGSHRPISEILEQARGLLSDTEV